MNDLRYEIKMLFEKERLDEARSWLLAHSDAFYEIYAARQVNNVYFDTFARDLLQQHIDGIAERAKVRFRWYGEGWQARGGQMEIKRKNGQLGNKHIVPVHNEIDFTYSWQDAMLALKVDLPDNFRNLLDGMTPTLINRYRREYYVSMDGVLRVTLDYNLRAFSQTFGLTPNIDFAQPQRDNLVIEMKADRDENRRIADALAQFPLYTTQNSKYLNGMECLF